MACTLKTSKTIIKIADVESGQIKLVLRGHHDLIHDLAWSPCANFLISASADSTCSVWDLQQKDADNAGKLLYHENDHIFWLNSLAHPSYVYACKVHPD
jgi:WD40 repeat protein